MAIYASETVNDVNASCGIGSPQQLAVICEFYV